MNEREMAAPGPPREPPVAPGDATLPQDERSQAWSASLSALKPTPPATVPGYQIQRYLGTGAFGTVWLAVENNTGKQVAIKFYSHRRGIDWSLLHREVEKLALLHTSRDVVGLLQVGWDADPPYYVMEYLPNGSLAGQLAAGGLPVGDAVRIAESVTAALVHAHEAGILHCDVKPANILLDTELAPRLADFGQARLSNEQSPALGTMYYMAPEQADLNAVPNARWDVYALGALLYHMLCGEPPHRTADTERRIHSAGSLPEKLATYRQLVQAGPVPQGHRQVRGVDAQLAEIVDRCLAPDPAKRYANAQGVAAALAARARYRAVRPVIGLGLILPAVLLAVLAPLGVQAMNRTVESVERNLAERALVSDLVTAKLLAYSLQDEIVQRKRYLEQTADLPELKELMAGVDGAPESRERRALARWLDDVKHEIDDLRAEQGLDLDVSWFLTDHRGFQRWRNPASPVTFEQNYSWRDYFHGSGGDQPEWRGRTDVAPLQRPHVSIPFRSEANDEFRIAISTPVRDSSGMIVGVLGRTISLDSLLSTYETRLEPDRLGPQSGLTFALVDTRSQLLLDHTQLTAERRRALANPQRWSLLQIDDPTHRQFQRLRAAVSNRNDPGDTPFSYDYHDPLERLEPRRSEPGSRLLAAFWPVEESDWIAVVQEDRADALQPVREIRSRLVWYGLAGVALMLSVVGVSWWLVRRVMQPHRGLPAAPEKTRSPDG